MAAGDRVEAGDIGPGGSRRRLRPSDGMDTTALYGDGTDMVLGTMIVLSEPAGLGWCGFWGEARDDSRPERREGGAPRGGVLNLVESVGLEATAPLPCERLEGVPWVECGPCCVEVAGGTPVPSSVALRAKGPMLPWDAKEDRLDVRAEDTRLGWEAEYPTVPATRYLDVERREEPSATGAPNDAGDACSGADAGRMRPGVTQGFCRGLVPPSP